MDFISGVSLSEVIRATGPMKLPVLARVSISIAEAFSYLHGQGLVRSDLKAANVLLTDDGGVFVCDFDTTYDLNGPPPPYGDVVMGTPAYMAPEQFELKGPPDARVDIYAFGALVYEMAKGHTPWPMNGDLPSMIRARQNGLAYDDEESLGGLYPIIEKCVRSEPSTRYSNFAEILFDLRALGVEETPASTSLMPLSKAVRSAERNENNQTAEFPRSDTPVATPRTEAVSHDDIASALSAALSGIPTLVHLRPNATTHFYRLAGKDLRIGRSSEADVVLADDQVSRIHAIVSSRDGGCFIRDVHSINGTLLNAELLKPDEMYPLRDADQIRIGASLFEFRNREEKLAAAT